jgi:hypothetical protein
MGSITSYRPVRTASIAHFNLCLDLHSSDTNSKEHRDFKAILNYANGGNDQEGKELNSHYALDWREVFFENLPYPVD